MFLTEEEVRLLTGYERKAAQIRWLRSHGFPFELGGDMVPKILRSYVIQRFGGHVNVPNSEKRPKLRLS